MKSESSSQTQQTVQQQSTPHGAAGDIPTITRVRDFNGSSIQDDPDPKEVRKRVLDKAKQKIKQVYALESRLPFYSVIAFEQSNRDAIGVSGSLMGTIALFSAESYKYYFVFHKLEGGLKTGEIHEEDLSKFGPEHVENGNLFRHLYLRRRALLDDSWTAVTVFQKKNPNDAVKELLKERLPFAKGADLDAVLNSYNTSEYTQVYTGSRKEVHSLIQASLAREIDVAHERAGKLVGNICADVIFTAAFGAPAVYLAWHSAMGLASNFGGEVAGAVILGLIALSILVALGANSRKHACYTQVGNNQYLRSHLGQTLFDIHEGKEPTQPQAVQATVVE